MSTELRKATINNTAQRTLSVYTENEAIYGAEPIEEVYPFGKTDYTTGNIITWTVPTDSRILVAHIIENADITGSVINFGITLPNGTILSAYAVNISDFQKRGNTYSFQFPDVFVRKGWVVGIAANVDLARISIVAKRISILPEVAPN